MKSQKQIHLEELNIVYEPILDDVEPEIVSIAQSIFDRMDDDPMQTLKEIELLIKKHPSEPRLRNWRLIACQKANLDEQHITKLIKDNYMQFPDYLFARCAYAQLHFETGRFSDVPKIFNNTFSLTQLYPERERFHVNEVVAHANILGQYMAYGKNFAQAHVYANMIIKLIGDSPAADQIHNVIFKMLPEKLMDMVNRAGSRGKKKRVTYRKSNGHSKRSKPHATNT